MVRTWAKFKGRLGWRKDMPQAERRALLEAKVKRDGNAHGDLKAVAAGERHQGCRDQGEGAGRHGAFAEEVLFCAAEGPRVLEQA